jgi:hypothetical protein
MGYYGNAMSHRAIVAYARHKMPAKHMADYLKRRYPKSFKRIGAGGIKKYITPCEYHHTGYNMYKTPFYSIIDIFRNRKILKKIFSKRSRKC